MKTHEWWLMLGKILAGGSAEKIYPPSDKEPGLAEKIVGTLTDPMALELWHFRGRLAEYMDDYKSANGLDSEDGLKKLSDADRDRHERHLSQIYAVSRAASGAFWFQVEQQFPDVGHKAVASGMRKDWQVVIWKRDNPLDKIGSLLSGIAGIAVVEILTEREFDPGRN